jgi:hypothetical protein
MKKLYSLILLLSFAFIAGQNNPPIANNQTITTDQYTPAVVSLVATDADDDILTYLIKSLPTNGILKNGGSVVTSSDLPLALSGNNITYTPSVNFSGTDSFTFVARDLSIASFAAASGLKLISNNGKPVTFDKPEGKTYYLIQNTATKMDWPDAKILTDSFDGAKMFVPLNETMGQTVYDALISMNRLDGPFWMGLYQDRNASDYSEPGGGWIWVDGVKLEDRYTNWYSNEPNNAGNEDYGQFNFGNFGVKWNDMSVGNGQSYALFEFSIKDDGSESNIATVTINVTGGGFNLQDDNNKIQVGSCTCNGKNDGTIDLSIEDARYDYTISVSGQSAPVLITGTNKTASVTGLAKGTYTVCFKVDGQAGYEQCFEAVVDQPKGL